MTHSPTPQVVHCPLSHPPHPPLPPLPSSSSASPALLPAGILLGCRRCSSARSCSPAPHPHHRHHRVHQHHHHHLPSLLTRSPSSCHRRHHHLNFSDVLSRTDENQADCAANTIHRDCQDCRCRGHVACASDLLHTTPPRPALTAAAGWSASKTWHWCRTLLTLPVLLLVLLLLPHRRKSRRYQLTRAPRLLLTVCLLTMLTGRCLASPWIEENANSVKLRAKVCQPVPEEHLRSMLGPAYDPSRMSSQDPRAAAGKRSDSSSAPEMEETAFDSYYMEDDPGAGKYVSEDFVDLVTEDGEEEQDWFRREEEVEDEDEGLEVQEKDFEEEERFYPKKRVGRVDSPAQSDQPKSRSRDRQPDRGQLHLYMKRRRRATGADRDRPSSAGSDSGSNKDKKNKDSLLPLRLLLSGRNRKLRRKLKKVFRKKAKKLGKKPPPWTCNMTKVWGRLKEGYFPRYLLDGRCATDKCFYRLYDCVPQKYRVKVLKRDPDYCNPLPALGANSTYEQKWSVVRYYVTVGCNCEAADPLQRSRSGRRRNS